MKNVFAFTAPGSDMPEFISVNDDAGAGGAEVTVRSAKDRGGNTASIKLTRDQAIGLAAALIANAGNAPAP